VFYELILEAAANNPLPRQIVAVPLPIEIKGEQE
jgi:hypothetical protein